MWHHLYESRSLVDRASSNKSKIWMMTIENRKQPFSLNLRRRNSHTPWSSQWLGSVHPQRHRMCSRSRCPHPAGKQCNRTNRTDTSRGRIRSRYRSSPCSCSRSCNTEFVAQGLRWLLWWPCIWRFRWLSSVCCKPRKQTCHRRRASEPGRRRGARPRLRETPPSWSAQSLPSSSNLRNKHERSVIWVLRNVTKELMYVMLIPIDIAQLAPQRSSLSNSNGGWNMMNRPQTILIYPTN